MDPIVAGKLLQNRFILGMTEFSVGVVFNLVTLIALFTSRIVQQSTGFYLLFFVISDTLYLTCTVFMEEFYNPLIGKDVSFFLLVTREISNC